MASGNISDLLDASSPRLVEPPGTREAVLDLVVAARGVGAARRRRRLRGLLVGAAATVLVGSGAAVAATVSDWQAPWAEHPLASISYTLPSGGTCEERIGDLHIADSKARRIITRWLASEPLDKLADIDGALARIRTQPNEAEIQGKSVAVGYGTQYYDRDYEYNTAVWLAVSTAIDDKLKSEGYTTYIDVTSGAETHCTGTRQDPGVPWYLR